MIHITPKRKLKYYDGNYDQMVTTKSEQEENQWKQYRWEQEQIKSMKDYIARFGHGKLLLLLFFEKFIVTSCVDISYSVAIGFVFHRYC